MFVHEHFENDCKCHWLGDSACYPYRLVIIVGCHNFDQKLFAGVVVILSLESDCHPLIYHVQFEFTTYMAYL